jgi:hypothetical protein
MNNFKVGDRVVLIDASKSKFHKIKNGTVLTITGFHEHTSDGPLIEFDGAEHEELDNSRYQARADCVVFEGHYNSPLFQAMLEQEDAV